MATHKPTPSASSFDLSSKRTTAMQSHSQKPVIDSENSQGTKYCSTTGGTSVSKTANEFKTSSLKRTLNTNPDTIANVESVRANIAQSFEAVAQHNISNTGFATIDCAEHLSTLGGSKIHYTEHDQTLVQPYSFQTLQADSSQQSIWKPE